MTKLSGWGNYTKVDAQVSRYQSVEQLNSILDSDGLICHAGGRSYGDSALSKHVIKTTKNNRFLAFNIETGLLSCEAGVTFKEIVDVFVPRGWFLAVTPGTKYVTLGGAIASDVHGKNHHLKGCFSSCVQSIQVMMPSGELVECSPELNTDLFQATCGGMGLTGVILKASFFLQRIASQMVSQKTIKTKGLEETFQAFKEVAKDPYSVAWIDCLAAGEGMGKGLVMSGKFLENGHLTMPRKRKLILPFNFPRWVLNPLSIKAFNWLYYRKTNQRVSYDRVNLDDFFYPLDHIGQWNKMYGKKGFLQYQFILPLKGSYEGMAQILKYIADSKMGSFLAVLKLYGEENENWLSFPMKGYSLALDFKFQPKLLPFLDKLDQIVMKCGGRIYLAKDARVNKTVFEAGYPKIEKFRSFREEHGLSDTFQSIQSKRLGI